MGARSSIQRIKIIIMTILPIAIYFTPISGVEAKPIPCLFRILFDKNCIGCGMSRACFNAIHFNFDKAIEYNPLVVVVLPLCIFYYCKYFIKVLKIYLRNKMENK